MTKKLVSENEDLHGNVPDHNPAVLLLVDVFNDRSSLLAKFLFPGERSMTRIRNVPAVGEGLAFAAAGANSAAGT